MLYLRNWKGIIFDPSKEALKGFKRWRSRDTFVNAIVGEEDNIDVDFYFSKYKKSSLTNTKYPANKDDYYVQKFRQVEVNNELKRQNINSIDVLNIDVEGAEFEILNNFDFEKFSPSIVIVEIHGNNLRECLESPVAKILLEKGYYCVASCVISIFFVRKINK